MNTNKTIHEAMGLCWHEIALVDEGDICEHCGEELEFDGYFHTNPDYTDPVHYCALMDWMRGKWIHLEIYIKNAAILDRSKPYVLRLFLERDRQEQITLIAEAIEAGVLK